MLAVNFPSIKRDTSCFAGQKNRPQRSVHRQINWADTIKLSLSGIITFILAEQAHVFI